MIIWLSLMIRDSWVVFIQVDIVLSDSTLARDVVPSGASTGNNTLLGTQN